MDKSKLYWSLQLGGWLAFALVQTIGFMLFGGLAVTGPQILFWFLEALIFLGITHGFRYIIIARKWLSLNMSRLIPRVIAAVVLLGVLAYQLRILISIPLGMYRPQVVWDFSNFFGLAAVYSLIIFLWSVLYFIYLYFERYNISLRQEAAMHEIELNNLKAQLNPHFIFNALNSIRALVDEDPKKSKNAITQLSHILRNSLISDQKRLTKFNQELSTVKDYLSLESIRYEERLSVTYVIHPDSNMYYLPPLMLQTLVENSIKHGIAKLKKGGSVSIRTNIEASELIIQIRNSGQYTINGHRTQRGGVGLKNTRQRLNLIYGKEASLHITNETDHNVLTELRIPYNINHESFNN